MSSIADESVHIQTSSALQFATPSWLGEVALVASHLQKQGLLNKISERVRFARRRFGRYDVLDFLAVLFGYALSGERTLEAFYEAVQPFASVFMALFGRTRLPAASTLSRFLAALPAEPVEALRTLFLEDLLTRRLCTEEHAAGLWDRQENRWMVFDVDGTREAARQRALPQTPDRPAPQRRLRPLCAPGYTGRKRGEVVRSRTTVLQMHTHQWVASFGNPGNGQYREELRRAKAAIKTYITAHSFPAERTLLRLDGHYGSGAVIADVADLGYVMRGKDYGLLDRAAIQARLHLPADQHLHSAESGICRALYDCPDQRLSQNGPLVRVIVATHPAPAKKKKKRQVGRIRDGVVSELFWTTLPQSAFTASDVVSLYLHRGAFETALEDEDIEQEPDRWCSHSAWGQEAWQVVAQWMWNLRLELGHHLHPEPLRTTEFGPALPQQNAQEPMPASSAACPPQSGYAPPATATSWKAGRFTGTDFPLQPDGTLRCPAGNALAPHERRRESDGSLRVVYSASIRNCRPCPLRDQCQWSGSATAKPRQVSILLHPLSVGSAPLLWRDWHRRHQRHACLRLHRQHLEVQMESGSALPLSVSPPTISRAERAHYRLSWDERLACNARTEAAQRITLTLFGIPDRLATFLGLTTTYHLLRRAWSHPHLSDKPAFPIGFFCLLCLIAPPISAPFSRFPFHPSISLRADLLPIPVERASDPENRLERFGELIAHVVGLAVSYQGGVDVVITGDSHKELLMYTAWIRHIAAKLRLPKTPKDGGFGSFLQTVDDITTFYFEDIYGKQAKEAVLASPFRAELLKREPLFFSIYADTAYKAGDHWDLLTRFLGFRFDDIAFSFTESDCANPALMAHLRGLKAEHVYDRSYTEGVVEYVHFATHLMEKKDFPRHLISSMESRYASNAAIAEMRDKMNHYAQEVLDLSENRIVCMLYSPFAQRGKNLSLYIQKEQPHLFRSLEQIHHLLAKTGSQTQDERPLARELTDLAHLDIEHLRTIYSSDLSLHGAQAQATPIALILSKDPHKMLIHTSRSPDGPVISEIISGR
jgi:hypothetical protein